MVTPGPRPGRRRLRTGHSLVELIVALLLLAVGLGAVGASALLGARWTDRGIARQEAVVAAAHVLDSLLLVPRPADGQGAWRGAPVRWTVRPGPVPGRAVTVDVAVGLPGRDGAEAWVALSGVALADPPALDATAGGPP